MGPRIRGLGGDPAAGELIMFTKLHPGSDNWKGGMI